MCYRCGKKCHRASEFRSKVGIPPTCTHCHQVSNNAGNCFVKKSNEAVEMQDVRFAKNSGPTEAKGAETYEQNNIIFVEEDDSVEEEHTVAAFKKSAYGETLSKPQRMQNDIDAHTKTQVKPKIAVRTNQDFPITRKAPEKSKGVKKSASKMVITELGRELRSMTLSTA